MWSVALLLLLPPCAAGEGPAISVWYGAHQAFGGRGRPQRWVNVLGRVSDPDGMSGLSFTLNGGPLRPLTLGPDERRLEAPGDFNVELDPAELVPGANELVFVALDGSGERSEERVRVDWEGAREWEQPFAVEWSEVAQLQDAVQVVDGHWVHDEAGLRTAPGTAGYDRAVAIGDIGWTDYEVSVSVTVHALDEGSYDRPRSTGPGVGIFLRWRGHTNDPVECPQLHCGWNPTGASNWYEWRRDGSHRLSLFTGPTRRDAPVGVGTEERPIELGATYRFLARVQTTPLGSLYRLKVWEDGVEDEPEGWMLERLTTSANLASGSLVLVAHHVEATFGDLAVVSLAPVSKWDLFVEWGGYAARSPLLLVAVLGIAGAWAVRRRNSGRDHERARPALVAGVLLLVAALSGAWLDLHLPGLLQDRGWSVRRLTMAAVAADLVVSTMVALGWGVLLVAVLRRR